MRELKVLGMAPPFPAPLIFGKVFKPKLTPAPIGGGIGGGIGAAAKTVVEALGLADKAHFHRCPFPTGGCGDSALAPADQFVWGGAEVMGVLVASPNWVGGTPANALQVWLELTAGSGDGAGGGGKSEQPHSTSAKLDALT